MWAQKRPCSFSSKRKVKDGKRSAAPYQAKTVLPTSTWGPKCSAQ